MQRATQADKNAGLYLRKKGKRVKGRSTGHSRTEVINEAIHFRDGVKNRRRGGKPRRKLAIRWQVEKEIWGIICQSMQVWTKL